MSLQDLLNSSENQAIAPVVPVVPAEPKNEAVPDPFTSTAPGVLAQRDESGLAPVGGEQYGAIAIQTRYAIADHGASALANISADALLADNRLRMSDAEAAGQITKIGQVRNFIAVQTAKNNMVAEAIAMKTSEVCISTAEFNHSTAVSNNKDAEDKAKHAEFMQKIRSKTRAHDRMSAVGKHNNAQARARKHQAIAKEAAIVNELGSASFNDAIDVEYS